MANKFITNKLVIWLLKIVNCSRSLKQLLNTTHLFLTPPCNLLSFANFSIEPVISVNKIKV